MLCVYVHTKGRASPEWREWFYGREKTDRPERDEWKRNERGVKEEEKTFTCPDKTALAGHENPSGFLDWSCKKERERKKRRRRKSHVFSRTALMCKMLLLVFSPRLETDVALFPAHQKLFFFVALFLIFTSLVVVYDWARLFGSYKLRGSTLHPFMPSLLDLEKFTWCGGSSRVAATHPINRSVPWWSDFFLYFFIRDTSDGKKWVLSACHPSCIDRNNVESTVPATRAQIQK